MSLVVVSLSSTFMYMLTNELNTFQVTPMNLTMFRSILKPKKLG